MLFYRPIVCLSMLRQQQQWGQRFDSGDFPKAKRNGKEITKAISSQTAKVLALVIMKTMKNDIVGHHVVNK